MKSFNRLSLNSLNYSVFLTVTAILLTTGTALGWEIRGIVTNENGHPIESASVVTNEPGIGGVTDSSGFFILSGSNTRPTRLTVSHLGYKPAFVSLEGNLSSTPIAVTLAGAIIEGQGITTYANRARQGKTPVAYSDITGEEIMRDYTTGDLPLALASAPNVHVWTDAGSNLGYSHIAIRGFDERRISVYVNGAPLNDPEDQVTYFVDLPDFTNNVRDIQIQRGVGASLYADGAFGGSVNIVSYALDQPRRFKFSTGIGEYWDRFTEKWIGQTTRQSAEFSSGLIDGQYHLLTRLSRQSTGGYVNRSWVNGWSYFISASRLDVNSSTTFNTYGGPIRTHAAWDGIDLDTYRINRRANFLTYAKEGDNFNQPHYELHNTYQLGENTILTSTAYYIRGVGFFDQLKTDRDPVEFNVPLGLVTDTIDGLIDVTVQQWVTKNQLGLNERLEIDHSRGSHAFGLAGYYFASEHWGEVNGAFDVASGFESGQRYYEYRGRKYNFSLFGDERLQLNDRLSAQFSLQLRHMRYEFDQTVLGAFGAGPQNNFNLDWTFLSPRVGLNYALDEQHSVFGSASISSRPPRDQDIYDANDPGATPDFDVASERVYDYELGYQYHERRASASINLFYMRFRNEVIFFGVDEDGSRLTDNAESSFHAGVELAASVRPISSLQLDANFSYNYNRYRDYASFIAQFDDTFASAGAIGVDYADNVIPNFPEIIGNLIADYHTENFRLTYRFRGIGRQFVESANVDSLSIAGHGVSSITGSLNLLSSATVGNVSLSLTVDNIFDKLYIQSGYGGQYALTSSPGERFSWGNYYASAGRSFFLQLQTEIL